MLMKIALPKMGELLVMTAVMISPSRREVSRAEQLWSRKPPYIFFQVKTPHIGEDGHRGPAGWPTRQGGASPASRPAGGPSCGFLSPDIFYIFRYDVLWSFRAFGVVQNRFPEFAPFPAQNSSCRHSPSSCKPCKIRENSHKYCDIT